MKTFGPPQQITFNIDLDGKELYGTLCQPNGIIAATWAANGSWFDLFPGALPRKQAEYWKQRLADPLDPLTEAAVQRIAFGLAEEVYGTSWRAAHQLCSQAAAQWFNFQTWAVAHQFDAFSQPAWRITAACWSWMAAGQRDENALKALERKIFHPATGYGFPQQQERLAANQAMFNGLGLINSQ
ncbi:hypothetical protein ACMATS_05875 [Streptoverticillium reticulum]|uniref:hypothetical protein n=1 Tax=Streptoverticillium reticulum TaxID=1433415 RepID=UPI0039BF0908